MDDWMYGWLDVCVGGVLSLWVAQSPVKSCCP